MVSDIFRSIFVSTLVELFVLVISLLFRNHPGRMIMVLALGSFFSAMIGFGPTILPHPILGFGPSLVSPLTTSPDERKQVEAVVERFFDLRDAADRYLDDSNMDSILTGDALQAQRDSIQTLREQNCYWIFSNRKIDYLSFEMRSETDAIVEVLVRNKAELYCNGALDPGSYSVNDPKYARLALTQHEGRWYITSKTSQPK